MFHFVFMIPLGGGSGGPVSKKTGIAILIGISGAIFYIKYNKISKYVK